MLTDNLGQWIDKCVRQQRTHIKTAVVVSLFHNAFSEECLPRGDRYRAPHSVSCSVGGSGSGVRGFVVLGICGTRVKSSVCRTTLPVAIRLKGAGSQEDLRLCGNDTFRTCERWRNPWDNLVHGQLLLDGRSSEVQDGCQALERKQSFRENG